MVLGGVIKFNSGDITHGQGLASGVTVENTASTKKYATTAMQNGAKLPLKVTAQAVITNARKASNMEANVGLAKQLSGHKLAQVDAALDMYSLGVDHSEQMMKREIRYEQITDKHGRAQLNHNLAIGVTQAESQGYYDAYTRASALDSL